MNQKNKTEFALIFSGTCEAYGKEATKTLAELYFNSLRDFPMEKVKESFNRHIRESKFFPKVSELIELLEGNKEEKALIAWTTFRDTIRHQGGDRSVIFTDPKITWIIKSYGGWIKVCEMETKDLDFMRLGFLKAYNNIRDGLPQEKLTGRFEWENSVRGYLDYIPKPLVIGENREILELTEN